MMTQRWAWEFENMLWGGSIRWRVALRGGYAQLRECFE